MCANIIGSCQHFLLLCRFKYCRFFFEKKENKRSGKKINQTQLKTPGRDVEGEKKIIDNQAKNRKNAALKVSAQN